MYEEQKASASLYFFVGTCDHGWSSNWTSRVSLQRKVGMF